MSVVDDPGNRFRFRPPAGERPAAIEDESADRLTIPLTEGSGAHAPLKAVYLDNDQPISRRIRCAIAALPFEVPKLAVTERGGRNANFASRLEAARQRSRPSLVIDNWPVAEGVPAADAITIGARECPKGCPVMPPQGRPSSVEGCDRA
jgi:hypothetical protein